MEISCVWFVCLFGDEELFSTIRLTHLLVVSQQVCSFISLLMTADVWRVTSKPLVFFHQGKIKKKAHWTVASSFPSEYIKVKLLTKISLRVSMGLRGGHKTSMLCSSQWIRRVVGSLISGSCNKFQMQQLIKFQNMHRNCSNHTCSTMCFFVTFTSLSPPSLQRCVQTASEANFHLAKFIFTRVSNPSYTLAVS